MKAKPGAGHDPGERGGGPLLGPPQDFLQSYSPVALALILEEKVEYVLTGIVRYKTCGACCFVSRKVFVFEVSTAELACFERASGSGSRVMLEAKPSGDEEDFYCRSSCSYKLPASKPASREVSLVFLFAVIRTAHTC